MTNLDRKEDGDGSGGGRRRWRRRLGWALVALVLILLGAPQLLRVKAVRVAVVDWLGGVLARTADLRLEMSDFDLDVSAGRLEVENVVLARVGATTPFLRVPRSSAEFAWRDLLTAPRHIRSLTVEEPIWDLDAPLPGGADAEQPPAADESGLPVRIGRIEIRDGTLLSDRPPPGLERWFASWRGRSIAAVGALDDGFTLTLAPSTLALAVAPGLDGEPVAPRGATTLTVAGSVAWREASGLTLDEITIEGDGLMARGTGRGRFGEGASFRVEATVESQPARLLDGLPAESLLNLSADLEVNAMLGRVQAEGRLIPAEVLRPVLGALGPELALEDTMLAFEADFDLGGTDPAATRGDAHLVWRRDDTVLLDLDATIAEPAATNAVRLVVDARVPSAGQGAPRVRGALVAPAMDQLDALKLDDLSLTVDTADAAALVASLARLMPGLSRSLPPNLAVGAFRVDATANGDPTSPALDLVARWRPDGAARLDIDAEGRLLAGEGQVDLTAEGLDLGRFRSDGVTTPLDVSLDVSLDLARVVATLRGGRVKLDQASVVMADRRASVTGDLDFDLSRGWSGARLRAAQLNVDAAAPSRGLTRFEGVVGLREGTLALTNVSGETTAGSLRVDGRVPLAGIAAWSPDLARTLGARLATLASGNATLNVDAPGFDSTAWWALVAPDTPEATVAGDVSVRLDIDPTRPATGAATVLIEGATLVMGDRVLNADTPVHLTMAEGQIVIAPMALHGTRGLDARVEMAAHLDPAWRPGQDPLDMIQPIRVGLRAAPGPDGAPAPMSWQALASLLGVDPGALDASAAWTIDLDLDLHALASSSGRLWLGTVAGTFDGHDFATEALELTLADGVVALAKTEVEGLGQRLAITAEAPIDFDALGAGGVSDAVGPLVVSLVAGPAFLGTDAPPWRFERLAALSEDGAGTLDEIMTSSSLEARVEVNLATPLLSAGTLRLVDLEIASGGRDLRARDDIVATLEGGRLRLAPARFDSAAGTPLALDAEVVWATNRPSESTDWIETVAARTTGNLPAAILNPYLASILGGASARGPIQVDIEVKGPPSALRGRARLDGAATRILIARPYFAQVENLDLDLDFAGGAIEITRGGALVNQGQLTLGGGRDAEGATHLTAGFDDVRLRADYGLTMLLDGELRYEQPSANGSSRLAGQVTVVRGQIRRYLDPDRTLVQQLFAPPTATASSSPELRGVELDLVVLTKDGIRVKNNLADLRASWSQLEVRGSLATPVIRGRIDTDPQGYLFAYGQALRLDRGAITFLGDPDVEPDLDFVITSSAQDPSVGREASSRFPAALRPDRDDTTTTTSGSVSSGVGDYYLDRIAGQLGSTLGAFDVSVGSGLPVFGETDPSRRLTVNRELSPRVSLAASFALDNEGDTTYVLDLHDFPWAERVVAQVFTTDEEQGGATLQQIFELGRPPGNDRLARLREIEVDAPAELKRRPLRRALGFSKGEGVSPAADFDMSIDVAEYLRGEGYPGASVDVTLDDDGRGGVVAHVTVDPGPPVRYRFEGDGVPLRARRAARTIYRPDLYEPVTLSEIETEVTRALRVEGHLEPKVDVAVQVEDPSRADSPRTVVVDVVRGEKVRLGEPRFLGLEGDTTALLEARFADPLSRADLWTSAPSSREAVQSALDGLGYPSATVEAIDQADMHPVVRVDPGPRERVNSVRVTGLPDSYGTALLAHVDVEAGSPMRRDRVAVSAARLESLLRLQGYAAARVRGKRVPVAGDALVFDVVFEVENAQIHRVAAIEFEGQHATRPRWAQRATGLRDRDLILDEAIGRARRSLYETGAFRSVVPRTTLTDDGTSVVTFELAERPRYRVALGGRWASTQGLATVVDVLDRNGFGRGVRLGVSARYAENDESVRLYGSIPNVVGTQADLDLFVEGREREDGTLLASRVDTTLQLSIPHGENTTSRVYLRYRDELVTDADGVVEPGDLVPTGHAKLPVVGYQWLRDTRDDRIEARAGSFFSLDVSATDRAIGSDLSYLRLLAQASHFRTLGRWRGRPLVWAQSIRVGLAESFDDTTLLRGERFFAGGEFSVRGYPEDSLGPRIATSDGLEAEGGEGLLVVNQELRIPLTSLFQGVVFFDLGNVFARADDLGDDLVQAAGVGLRARTPVGLLRADIAFPLDRRKEDDEYEVYLGFGFSF